MNSLCECCVCGCMYVCIPCIYVIRMCMHIYIRTFACIHVPIHAYVCIQVLYFHVCCTCVCIHAYILTYQLYRVRTYLDFNCNHVYMNLLSFVVVFVCCVYCVFMLFP